MNGVPSAKQSQASAEPASAPAPEAHVRRDLAISELTGQERSALEDLPFFASLDFAMLYEHPPAERVFVHWHAGHKAARAGFYRERRWLGIIRAIEFIGLPSIEAKDVAELLQLRAAHVASLSRMHDPESAQDNSTVAPHINTAVNVIVNLPPEKDEYFASLGKQKRQQLPRYWRRVQREFNDRVSVLFRRNGDIDIEQITRLVEFNQTRMAAQGKANATALESQKQHRRAALTQKSGLLCTMEADGRVLGGTFNYIHNDEAFLIVIAHDPALERLNIGHLCLWRTVEHVIELGIRRYHLLWGKKLYKTQFGGMDHQASMTFIARQNWVAKLARTYWMTRVQLPRAIRFLVSMPKRLTRRSAPNSDAANDD